jgi:hypothetical protein
VRLRATGLNVRAVPRMSEATENVKKLIESLTPSELQSLASYLRSKISRHPLEEKWDISYELILDAIHRHRTSFNAVFAASSPKRFLKPRSCPRSKAGIQ